MLAELTDTSEMMVSVVNRTWCDMFDPEGQGQVRTREQEDATQTEGRTSEVVEDSLSTESWWSVRLLSHQHLR